MTLLTYAMDLHKANIKTASEVPTQSLSNDIHELDTMVDALLRKSVVE